MNILKYKVYNSMRKGFYCNTNVLESNFSGVLHQKKYKEYIEYICGKQGKTTYLDSLTRPLISNFPRDY